MIGYSECLCVYACVCVCQGHALIVYVNHKVGQFSLSIYFYMLKMLKCYTFYMLRICYFIFIRYSDGKCSTKRWTLIYCIVF